MTFEKKIFPIYIMSSKSFFKQVFAPALVGLTIGSIFCLIFEEAEKRNIKEEEVMKFFHDFREGLEAKLNQTQKED